MAEDTNKDAASFESPAAVFVDDAVAATMSQPVATTKSQAAQQKGNDSDVTQPLTQTATTLAKVRSSGSLASSRSSRSSASQRPRYGFRSSPLRVPLPFQGFVPTVDQFGHPVTILNRLDESEWNTRHHLNGNENELKPKPMRDYFSRPQNMDELVRDLKYNPSLYNTKSIIKTMSLPEINDRKPSPICPDSGPPLVPIRHFAGGNMKDRDGLKRVWNDRWEKNIGALNHNVHPDHRAYFTQKSLFEESPSQRWRRYLDQKTYEFNRTLSEEQDSGLQFSSRPWNSSEGELIVGKLKKDGWAEKQGIVLGASILSVNSQPVSDLSEAAFDELWKKRPLVLAISQATTAWTTIQCRKPERFPSLGCRMHGRSGTPIPGATS
jgi:hypothetical protein